MPTPTLHLKSPFKTIFNQSPNYFKLNIFGCLCYLWLKPYTNNKLESNSKPFVFLGYSTTQSAYFFCLDPKTSKIYVSRHVKFFESLFPFKHLKPTESRLVSNTITIWFPPLIHLSVSSLPVPLITPSLILECQQPSNLPQPSALPLQNPSTISSHFMITRGQNHIHKPIKK